MDLVKPDYLAILKLITPGSSVLDLGCGSGDLLALLEREKKVKGQGIEVDDKAVFDCVTKGLNVFHGDIDTGLSEYGDKSFEYVIMHMTIQQVKKPDFVLIEAMRVGKKVIVGIPNFAYINARFQIFFRGRTPVTPSLPYEWYDTPNLHFLSIVDFIEYCRKQGIAVEKSVFLGTRRKVWLLPNLFAQIGIFIILDTKRNGM
ncbi:MAG: methionine biosynthesis protein MetW [Deltaproteobacteria bacterium]